MSANFVDEHVVFPFCRQESRAIAKKPRDAVRSTLIFADIHY